jgi:hypothetical protein
MAIEFVCPSCNGTLQVGDDAAGRVIRCGGCMTMLRVPGGAPPGGSAPQAPVSPFEPLPSPPPSPSRRSFDSPADVEPLPDEPRRRRRRERDGDEDDYGEDRPRRRRDEQFGEAPPPGRSALVWLVGIGAVGFVAILGCCGGLFMLLPKEKWQTHESKDGKFRVELPAAPKNNPQEDAGVGLRPGTKAEGTSHVMQHFLVLYREIPSTKERAANGGSDQQQIAESLELIRAAGGAQQPNVTPMTVGGFPASEIAFRGRDGRNYTARVVVADTRLYVILTCGPQAENHASVKKFLNSFEITDPDLVRIGKAREEAKKAADGNKGGKVAPAPPKPDPDDKD